MDQFPQFSHRPESILGALTRDLLADLERVRPGLDAGSEDDMAAQLTPRLPGTSTKVRASMNLGIGQESVCVGAIAALRDTELVACVFAANQISKKLQFGFGGNPCIEELTPSMQKRLGGTLDEVIVSLGDLAPMFEEAKIFAKL